MVVAEGDADLPAFALDEALHRVHADAAARDFADDARRREAGGEDQLGDGRVVRLIVLGEQSPFDCALPDTAERQPAAVVLEAHHQLLAGQRQVERDGSGRMLAGEEALGDRFDAVVERIAVEMHEDVAQQVGDLVAQDDSVVADLDPRRLLGEFLGERRQRGEDAFEDRLYRLAAELLQVEPELLQRGHQALGARRLLAGDLAHIGDQLVDLGALDHHVFLGAAAAARTLAPELVGVEHSVFVDAARHLLQLLKQLIAVEGAALAQVVVGLLGQMDDMSELQQAVSSRVALDGVHIAEELRREVGGGGRSAVGGLQQRLVVRDEAARAAGEFVELLLADRQDLADHLQLALLLLGFGFELPQLADVANANHDFLDRVVIVADRRPGKFEVLDAAVGHRLAELAGEQVRVEVEVHAVFAEAGEQRRFDLRQRIGAEAAVAENEVDRRPLADVLRFEDRFEVVRVFRVDRAAGDDRQNPLRQMPQHGLDVARLLAQQRRALRQALDHQVELGADGADLVVGGDLDARAEVAFGHGIDRRRQAVEPAHDRDVSGDEAADHQRQHGQHRQQHAVALRL